MSVWNSYTECPKRMNAVIWNTAEIVPKTIKKWPSSVLDFAIVSVTTAIRGLARNDLKNRNMMENARN